MSETIQDTPALDPEYWCPDCEGPPKSDRASLAYCHWHRQHNPPGTADAQADFPVISTWTAEAGGPDNVTMCNMIHRKETT